MTVNIENIPCRDCITFAMCKARIMSSDDKSVQHQNVLQHIFTICTLLRDYASHDEQTLTPESYIKTEYVLEYFRGNELSMLPKSPGNNKLCEFYKAVSLVLLGGKNYLITAIQKRKKI